MPQFTTKFVFQVTRQNDDGSDTKYATTEHTNENLDEAGMVAIEGLAKGILDQMQAWGEAKVKGLESPTKKP